ncbi:MAG: hypothetical protein V4722_23055 [Bacteroidota bacterium]
MPRILFLTAVLSITLFSCTTKAFVQKPAELKGKKIGIGPIKIEATKKGGKLATKDTICLCIGQSAGEAFQPYLQEAGFRVVNLYLKEIMDVNQAYLAADSLQVDYILFGSGTADIQGKYTYMDQLTVKLVNVKTREVVVSGSFTGSATSPIKAAGKIGKKILQQMK